MYFKKFSLILFIVFGLFVAGCSENTTQDNDKDNTGTSWLVVK